MARARCTHTLPTATWGSAERIMPASADELADLENRLLSKQQSQYALQKRLLLGNAAPTVVEVDQPFAEYARTFYLTAALVVYSLASMVYSSFTTGLTGSFNQVNFLFPFALAWTASATQIYTTLDSETAGRRAVQLIRCYAVGMMLVAPLLYWTSGLHDEAVLMFFLFGVDAIIFPWLFNAIRETVRKRHRGSLTALAQNYTMRALKIAGFQIVLSVSAAAQGIDGPSTFPRIHATLSFMVTLPFVSIFLIGVFDACAVDAHAATKLRVSPLQAAAVASCGALILSGLAGYVLAEQRDPSKRASHSVMYVMFLSNYLCAIFVGRLVCVARRTASDAPSAASVQPSGGLDVVDIPGA